MLKPDPQLIIPFAKQSGMTSFSSLWQVKQALGTKKVGHCGTLDSFADGLLVLLSGKLTKLVPYITEFDKRYTVRFYFGEETDTLDPEGTVIERKPLPLYDDFIDAVGRYQGRIEQLPPVYSALKDGGERLSDKVRRGETVTVKPRIITVHRISITDVFFDQVQKDRVCGAVMDVHCSKGTYIRSLVRDIAHACGSAGYVHALRRTAIGPFTLEQAAGYSALADSPAQGKKKENASPSRITRTDIDTAAFLLDESACGLLGFQTAAIKPELYTAFVSGKKIQPSWFFCRELSDAVPIAVIHQGMCIGLIVKQGSRYSYKIVFG